MSSFKPALDNRIIHPGTGSVESFQLSKTSIFVVLFFESSKRSWGVVLSSEGSFDFQLRKIFEVATQAARIGEEKIQAKLVSSSKDLISSARSRLDSLGVSQIQDVLKSGDLEIIYNTYPLRVRVAAVLVGFSVKETEKKNASVSLESVSAPKAVARKRRVLIVDDSKTIRQLLTQILSSDSELEIVATAEKPSDALKMIQLHNPDVVTLDIHMPEMDGVTFLKSYLPQFPIPTVMISSISLEEGPAVLQALECGAVDYIQKPGLAQLEEVAPLMIEKVKQASFARVNRPSKVTASRVALTEDLDFSNVFVIGSSTGGTEALRVLLTALPDQIPPTLIVQHIPPVFSKAFADRMNQLCAFEVREAVDGDVLAPSLVLVAPGGKQMKLIKTSSGDLRVKVDDSPPMNRHKPSVDFLFYSVAELLGKRARGVILTGMGADGARGLLKVQEAGAPTIAQDEASCVVFGMPREAIKLGAAAKVLPLTEIAGELVRSVSRKKNAA